MIFCTKFIRIIEKNLLSKVCELDNVEELNTIDLKYATLFFPLFLYYLVYVRYNLNILEKQEN